MQQYLEHSKRILTDKRSNFKGGSKGMALISLFGHQNEYDLRDGLPLLTTKKLPFKGIVHELLWFIKGETNLRYLAENNVHIWDGNAFDHNIEGMVKAGIFPSVDVDRYKTDKSSSEWKGVQDEYVQKVKEDTEFAARWGDLGPVYGSQWRKWRFTDEHGNETQIDQLERMLEGLAKNPGGKGNIVTAWNPGEVPHMALRPCHVMYQVTSSEGNLEMQMYQRSCDQFLGVPFNIASYAMLAQIIAQQAGLVPKTLIHAFGDSHFYAGDGERAVWHGKNLSQLRNLLGKASSPSDYLGIVDWINTTAPKEREEMVGQDHVTAIIEQLAREPRELPRLQIADKHYSKLTIDDFTLTGYNPHNTIKRKMAV